jgi:hypothetical protein
MRRDALTASTESSDSHSVSLVLTACVISILLIFLVYSQDFVFGSQSGNWVYPYFETPQRIPLWLPLVVLFSLGLLTFIAGRLVHSHERVALLAGFLGVLLVQSLIRQVYPFSLGSIVQSDQANSFYSPAMRHSALEILTRYDQLAPSFPPHARSNMPGKILLFQILRLFTSSPEVMGYLVIVVSSLGALLLYGICKKLFHDKQVAIYALILYALVPCKLFFLPLLNTVTPVLMLLCFYLFLVYVEKKRLWIAWLLGGALYILILFEPSPLITGILWVGIWIHAMQDKRFSWKDSWRLLANSLLGFLAVYAIFLVFFSFSLLQSGLYVLRDAVSFNVAGQRDYMIWLGGNAKEFFYVVGAPIMILFIYMTVDFFSQWRTPRGTTLWSSESVFLIGLLVTFFAVLFLGINRGETTRLWIYLAVLFQVPASVFLAKMARGQVLFSLVAVILAIQCMLTLQRVGFVIP